MPHNATIIKKALEQLKIEALNPMQKEALTAFQQPGDLMLLSPTGSGKTLGFLLPALLQLDPNMTGIQTLILAPTRELALQIESVFRDMATGYKVNCFYGGHDFKTEKNSLQQPPSVLIGTPGRITDHLEKGSLDPVSIRTLVLDEFDKSLEFGFEPEMKYIITRLPNLKKRMLTSATELKEIPSFTGLKQVQKLNYLAAEAVPSGLDVKTVLADGPDKLETLLALLGAIGNEATIVFCNHRDALERISTFLKRYKVVHDLYHGKLEQEERERALIKFRNGSNMILVTTDLAARGLDISQVRHVVHYQLPVNEQSFIHRNGRTARMNAEGTAYLIMSPKETIPPYINTVPENVELPAQLILPDAPEWTTLYIGAGKKEKVNKVDIVGWLLQKGKLEKSELGMLNVGDHISYAAVNREKAKEVLQLVRNEKLKNKSIKVDIAK